MGKDALFWLDSPLASAMLASMASFRIKLARLASGRIKLARREDGRRGGSCHHASRQDTG